ncbi:MAG: hypothetical protein ACYTBJ_05785 [Planctomycetota bacterium]|jgi:hypothetical protein
MESSNFEARTMRRRSGIVGLFLILVLGIAAMVFLFSMYSGGLNPFAPWQGTAADRYSDANALPWEEAVLFINTRLDGYDMGGRRPPFRGQPKLKDGYGFKAEVYEGMKPRGEVEISITKDGDVKVTWAGEFEIGGKKYKAVVRPKYRDVESRNVFLGNVAPLKLYEDEKGINKRKLYFITVGAYYLEGPTVGDLVRGYDAYVTGWIDKRYKAEGKLWIKPFIDGKAAIWEWGPVEKTSE